MTDQTIDPAAYEQGRRDYSFGLRQIQNPHRKGSIAWHSWDKGWSEEREEYVDAGLLDPCAE